MTKNMWYLVFELGLSHSTWWSPVPHISCKWHHVVFLYGWVIFHDICIYHIFFVHLLVVGNFSWFNSLAIMDQVAINMVMQVSLLYIDFHSLDICPSVVWCCHKVSLFLHFWVTSIVICMVVVPVYLPTNSVWGFLPQHAHQHLLLFVFLMIANLTGVRWNLSECWFEFPFS
jgi:hypothetical protein